MKNHLSTKHFDFTRAYIGKHTFVENTLIVPIKQFGIIKGYSSYENYTFFEECTLMYKGVVKSIREIHEYIPPDNIECKPMYMKTDVLHYNPVKPIFLFGIEGVSVALDAWIEWDIIATSVDIE